jgi:hypothetical protein
MSNELIILEEFTSITQKSGIEKATEHAATFAPFMIIVKELSQRASAINSVNPTELDSKLAREIRLALVRNRTSTVAQKDSSKTLLNAESNLIQNLHNIVINTSQLIEADLMEVEKYQEFKEQKRVSELDLERRNQIKQYIDYSDTTNFGIMDQVLFDNILSGAILSYEKKIEYEKAAALKKIEDDLELERTRKENENLKKQSELKESRRNKRNSEMKFLVNFISDYNVMLEMDEDDYLKTIERIKISAVNFENKEAEKRKIEAKNQEKIDAILRQEKEQLDRERKEKQEKLIAEQIEAKKPIKEKLLSSIENLKLDLPASEVTDEILTKFKGFKNWAVAIIDFI